MAEGRQKGSNQIHFDKTCHNYPKSNYHIVKVSKIKDETLVCSSKKCSKKFETLQKECDEKEDSTDDDEEEEEEEEVDERFMVCHQKNSNKIHVKECSRLPKTNKELKDYHQLDIRNVDEDYVSNCCQSAFKELKKVLKCEDIKKEENRDITPLEKKVIKNKFVLSENDKIKFVSIENDSNEYYDLKNKMFFLETELDFVKGLLSGLLLKYEGKTLDDFRKCNENVEIDSRFDKYVEEESKSN